MRLHSRVRVPLVLFALLFLLVAAFQAPADERDEARGFIESIAGTVYAAAWPTATYDGLSFKSYEPVEGGFDLIVRLSGKSAFSGGDLWVDLAFQFRNGGKFEDVAVRKHNAILAPPFSTIQALGEMIAEMADEGGTSSGDTYDSPTTAAAGHKLVVTNRCRRSVQVAVGYQALNGDWLADGWWTIASNTTKHLNGSSGSPLRTHNEVIYFYAETSDRSIVWNRKDWEFVVAGRALPMTKIVDSVGDREWTLNCDGL